MVGLTATLEPGRQEKAVVKVLGSRVGFPSRNTIVSVITSTSSHSRDSVQLLGICISGSRPDRTFRSHQITGFKTP